MLVPPIWMLKDLSLHGDAVVGAEEIIELVGQGKAPVELDKKVII